MTTLLRNFLRSLPVLFALTGVAQAHPHVWITFKSELIYGSDGALTGIRHAWSFDDMFSVFATQGIEAKEKGKFTREELAALVREEAPDGMDVVVDTTGNSRMFETCLGLIRREGRLLLQGYYPDPIVIDFHRAHLQRVTVVFPCGWDREDDQALADDLSRGVPTVSPLITHRVPYREAPEAYRLVVEHPERCLGMVLRWSEP